LRLEVKDPDSYSIKDTETYLMTPILAKPDTYWIEITNFYQQLKDRECIYRVLVDSAGKCWRFENNPDLTVVEEEVTEGPFDKWDYDLESAILGSGFPYQAPVKSTTTNSFGYSQFSKFRLNQTKKMNSKRNNTTVKNASQLVAANPNTKGLSDKTKLPVQYQITYKTMSKWWESVKLPDWPEAAPASFRATLLYNKPTLPTEYGSTYICDDIWADKKMRTIPPFAALEALYYNRDDGTPDVKNTGLLTSLSQAFNTVYENASQGKSGTARNSTRAIKTFFDVSVPAESTVITTLLCGNTSAQGEAQINRPEIATILAQAQNEIVAKYKIHVDRAYDLLKALFEIGIVNGETIIKFTDEFTNTPKGVRTQLEEIVIPNAIILIANHYLEVEEIYYKAISAITNLPVLQRG